MKNRTQIKISKGIYKTTEGTYMARTTKSKNRVSRTFKKLKDAKAFYKALLFTSNYADPIGY